MAHVGGADGFRRGWFVALLDLESGALTGRRVAGFGALLDLPEAPVVLAVDMVIGLPEAPTRGGRTCDRMARRLLGRPRGSSVFSPPARAALGAATYEDALALNRAASPDGIGLSREAFHLLPKMREVDALLTPALQARVVETHPELSFFEMNGRTPVVEPKHSPEGRRLRTALLRREGLEVEALVRSHVGRTLQADDVLDAVAACWTAARLHRGGALRLPPAPERDGHGLRMEIWR